MPDKNQYREKAESQQSPAELVKFLSQYVYEYISLAYKENNGTIGSNVLETSLTDILYVEILRFNRDTNLRLVTMYKAKNEPVNGADLLLYIPVDDLYIKVPVQAKLLSSYAPPTDGSYKYFKHSNHNGAQVDLLRQYAERLGSKLALYLFYNFTENSQGIDPADPEALYGCSYVNVNIIPRGVYQKKNVLFTDLHRHPGKPFYHLFTGPWWQDRKNGDPPKGRPKDQPESSEPGSSDKGVPYEGLKEIFRFFGQEIDNATAEGIDLFSLAEILSEIKQSIEIFPTDVVRDKDGELVFFEPKYAIILQSSPQKLNDPEANEVAIPGEGSQWGAEEQAVLQAWLGQSEGQYGYC